ncbi:hypothetical protein FRE64_06275 [Euhalothece natronophila Z-M001]|uniref:Uncharacterized protein n=1 Tax=Euhalothece natronophila Z-M001 TaxID=522448 RepID=A0A5B8NN40_9CHRO|nr:hypothetical protein [Euhalothece natronophila]QDZ39569.1 hypothetical protein FRE64_06275 [Euhalothece natronophila Z-M001]
MAQTHRKPVYIQPKHHDILRRIAFEQKCNISDVLDVLLDEAEWQKVAKIAKTKPKIRAKERQNKYKY